MRILYGVVGEGMGHATRSRVVLTHLLSKGHQIRVVVSGKAHQFLSKAFQGNKQIQFEEIQGLHLAVKGNALDVGKTVLSNVFHAPFSLLKNLGVYLDFVASGFQPEVVISDFESWAYLYAINHQIPLISIDNQQVMARCRHDRFVTAQGRSDYQIARWMAKLKIAGAYHYLVTSFFFPPINRPRTTLLPPILRPEILAAKREPRDHVLVYPSVGLRSEILPLLKKLPYRFRVYGTGQEGEDANVSLRPFSEKDFVDDFRTARAVIAGGGFSMMSEAVHLRVPLLSIPIEGQYEQEMNARYLARLKYGTWMQSLNLHEIELFLQNTDDYAENLEHYPSQGNQQLFGCLDELLRCISLDEPAPSRLESPAMGKYEGPLLPDEFLRPQEASF